MARKETSYGVIPIRKWEDKWQVLLVKHGKGHWSFPKGHPEEGETPKETAARELLEETGLQVKEYFPIDSLSEHYMFRWEGILINKTVIYFVAYVFGEVVLQERELSEYAWCSLEEAEELASFPQAKSICRELRLL